MEKNSPAAEPVWPITDAEPPEEVSAAVTAMMRKNSIPGLSLAVVNRKSTLWAAGSGQADYSSNQPAVPSTAYLWFSMSKLVTATTALILADQGRLDLDAPAGEYVPYLKAPGHAQPSVRHLVTHMAGLGNPLPMRWVHPINAPRPDPEALLRRLIGRRRAFRYPVGQFARYSNVGYLALGQVIAAAADMPFETCVRQFVLQPVGMDHTGFAYPRGMDRAVGYVKSPRATDPALRRLLPTGVVGYRHGRYLALNPFYVDGPAYGGLVGNVLDAARFLRMHLGDGELDGHRILEPETARRMRNIDHPGRPFHHGAGWFRRPTRGPGDWVEHFGAGAGFWNVMRLYPERGIGIVVMANTTAAYDFEPLFALIAGPSGA